MNPQNHSTRSMELVPHFRGGQTEAESPGHLSRATRRKVESWDLNLGLTAKACSPQHNIPTSWHLLGGSEVHRV